MKIDWNKPIEVIDEINGKVYEAQLIEEEPHWLFVHVTFKNFKTGFFFSRNGRKRRDPYDLFKLVARNVEESKNVLCDKY